MRGLVGMVLLLAVAGCGEEKKVRAYRAPADTRWRMIGAIVTTPDQTWFFKTTAPEPRLSYHKGAILKFLETVSFHDGRADWTLPKGWTEEEGEGGRSATLKFDEAPSIELTVTRLDGMAGGVIANVNRWLGQLGLASVDASSLERVASMIQVGGFPTVLVDAAGPTRPRMAPFAGGGGMGGGGSAMPPDHPAPAPSGSGNERERVRAMFAFNPPSGWTENPAPQGNRIAEFEAGGSTVVLTALQGSAGGIAPNVNRWREQAGLPPVEDAVAEQMARPIEFMGAPGRYLEVTGAERSMLVAFALRDDISFFLKMDGPAAAVAAQKDAFETFALSARFDRKHD